MSDMFSTLSATELGVYSIGGALVLWASYFLLGYFSAHGALRKFPGPPAAAWTQLWLAKQVRHGVRSPAVHQEHLKHGKFVRIGPNEISIADPAALPVVYGFAGSHKSNFYDAFVSLYRGLFNTRDRAQHTRKRKIISHSFAPKSVREFEPYIAGTVRTLLAKWDALCDRAAKEQSGELKGWAVIELLDWMNALAFDIIGDLAFGSPFGMLDRDAADIVAITTASGEVIHAPAVKILNERGEYSATQGSLPPWIRPYTRYYDPWFARGLASVQNLAGIAVNKVSIRLAEGAGDRKDILSHLTKALDDEGKPLGKTELTAEALTQLIAGSDTTSNSSCAIIHRIVRSPRVHEKLQAELDEAFAARGIEGVIEADDTKPEKLPYMNACLSEALRMHSTSGMGLPRIMDRDTEFDGHVFPAGTILSVPSYTIHHLESVWGDPWEFRPERWLEEDTKAIEKALNVFSFGPRSCVGRNVAMQELQMFIATLLYRYDFHLTEASKGEMEVDEGFLRKPRRCQIGIKRRSAE